MAFLNIVEQDVLMKQVLQITNRDELSAREKRILLNELEKEYPQEMFIKTHLCDNCEVMKIEDWLKTIEVSI